MKRLILLFALIPAIARAQWQVATGDATFKIPVQAISSSDHVAEKTDVSSLTCYKSENGGAATACGGTSAELDDTNAPGLWHYTLAAGDVDTAGTLALRFSASGMDPFRAIVQIGGVSVAANGIGTTAFAARGTAQSVTANTIQLASTEDFGNNSLDNYTAVTIVSASTGKGQTRCIVSYASATDTATVEPWQTTPTGTITYDLISDPACKRQMTGSR